MTEFTIIVAIKVQSETAILDDFQGHRTKAAES